jgi:hypothetical protein
VVSLQLMKADEEEGRGSPMPMLEHHSPMGALSDRITHHGGITRPCGAVFVKKEIIAATLIGMDSNPLILFLF